MVRLLREGSGLKSGFGGYEPAGLGESVSEYMQWLLVDKQAGRQAGRLGGPGETMGCSTNRIEGLQANPVLPLVVPLVKTLSWPFLGDKSTSAVLNLDDWWLGRKVRRGFQVG